MPLWLILAVIAVGVIADIVGCPDVGNILIWVGVIILVVGPGLTLLTRRRNGV
jgi:hypothetical protein